MRCFLDRLPQRISQFDPGKAVLPFITGIVGVASLSNPGASATRIFT
jgi:hypothetical protein